MAAPAKLPVELVWIRGEGRRAFRLSSAIDPERILFERELPFPEGEPASATFTLPDEPRPITATVELHPQEARFLAIAGDDRGRILAYFKERLGLP